MPVFAEANEVICAMDSSLVNRPDRITLHVPTGDWSAFTSFAKAQGMEPEELLDAILESFRFADYDLTKILPNPSDAPYKRPPYTEVAREKISYHTVADAFRQTMRNIGQKDVDAHDFLHYVIRRVPKHHYDFRDQLMRHRKAIDRCPE